MTTKTASSQLAHKNGKKSLLSYHKGQRGEEDTDDQTDVRSVAQYEPQALSEGEGFGRFVSYPLNEAQMDNEKL